MQINKLELKNPREVQKFINLPFKLYHQNQQWVPPLMSEMKMVLNRSKHPYYRHSEAEFFIAEEQGETLGRIAVMHNRHYCDYHKKKTGFIYYFECVEDTLVSRGLFNAAADWARQRGLENLLGPKGFLRSSGMGVLIDGFEYLPSLGIPYNLPYYSNLFEDWGFKKKLDQFSFYMDISFHFPPKMFEAAEKVKQRGGFWIKTFKNNNEMRKLIPQVKKVQEISFADNPNYYPSTDAEFDLIANNLIQIAVPGLIRLVMKGEEVAGFVLGYPDISRALQKTRGKLFPLGWIALLREKKCTKVVDYNGIGLLPQYQGLGSNMLLYVEMEKSLRETSYEIVDLAQVNEDNYKSMADWENLGARCYKTHRTYEVSLKSL